MSLCAATPADVTATRPPSHATSAAEPSLPGTWSWTCSPTSLNTAVSRPRKRRWTCCAVCTRQPSPPRPRPSTRWRSLRGSSRTRTVRPAAHRLTAMSSVKRCWIVSTASPGAVKISSEGRADRCRRQGRCRRPRAVRWLLRRRADQADRRCPLSPGHLSQHRPGSALHGVGPTASTGTWSGALPYSAVAATPPRATKVLVVPLRARDFSGTFCSVPGTFQGHSAE